MEEGVTALLAIGDALNMLSKDNRAVEREADAMGQAELFLCGKAVA